MISVIFDELVTVSGIPQIILETGDIDGTAYYTGQQDSTLIFEYIVDIGHNSEALDYVSSSSFSVLEGNIEDLAKNDANLLLPEPNYFNSLSSTYQIIIDTHPPVGGYIFEGIDIDESWTNQDSSLSFSWNGFNDNISGLNRYEFSIGTSQKVRMMFLTGLVSPTFHRS